MTDFDKAAQEGVQASQKLDAAITQHSNERRKFKDLRNPCAHAVRDFHIAFSHPYSEVLTVPPYDLRALRVKLLLEEVVEFAQASGIKVRVEIKNAHDVVTDIYSSTHNDTSIVEAADALGDIEYVAHGAAHCWGIPLQAVFDEVHRSNMAKLGPDGKPIYREDGKVLKPEGWTKPNIGAVLRANYGGHK